MKAVISVRGKTSEWAIAWDVSKEQIDAMREDGLEVGVLQNTVPFWVYSIGLSRPWCFVQDVWNFRNPFRK